MTGAFVCLTYVLVFLRCFSNIFSVCVSRTFIAASGSATPEPRAGVSQSAQSLSSILYPQITWSRVRLYMYSLVRFVCARRFLALSKVSYFREREAGQLAARYPYNYIKCVVVPRTGHCGIRQIPWRDRGSTPGSPAYPAMGSRRNPAAEGRLTNKIEVQLATNL